MCDRRHFRVLQLGFRFEIQLIKRNRKKRQHAHFSQRPIPGVTQLLVVSQFVVICSSVQSNWSIAAGVNAATLDRWLGGNTALVRSMPNTPAMLQCGATALFANDQVSDAQREQAETIMRAVGLTRWLTEEQLMDSVTAVSGSGPAYFFLVMEAMQDAALQLGLDEESARLLTLQTALGAARMAIESSESPAMLRARVTSPGGTTESAIRSFEDDGLRQTFVRALTAARDRSVELSEILAGSS